MGSTNDRATPDRSVGETPSRTSAVRTATRAVLSRSSVPYYVAAFALAAAMAWYFFLYVPAKLEYFVGVRLRALAVAGSQLRTKAVNLASALDRAACGYSMEDVQAYLRLLVPDVRVDHPGESPRPGLHLLARGCRQRVTVTGTVAWQDLIAQAANVSREDFDDLVLALPGGEVVWQREDTAPRVGNLAQVLYADEPETGWFAWDWNASNELPKADAARLPMAGATRRVSLAGRDVLLLVQPVTLPPDWFAPLGDASTTGATGSTLAAVPGQVSRTMYVAAMVSRSTLQAQAMDVPLAWVVLLALPMILLFLALPFVKLATQTPRERFALVDLLALLVAVVVLASIAAAMPFVISPLTRDTDTSLKAFSDTLEDAIVSDVRVLLEFGQFVSKHEASVAARLAPCRLGRRLRPAAAGTSSDVVSNDVGAADIRRCDLWTALKPTWLADDKQFDIDLDVVMWLGPTGQQLDKWTTKAQVTDLVSHAGFRHFRDLDVGRLWRLAGEESRHLPRFTLEPLRAPTTADLGVVVAFPIEGRQDGATYLAANVRLPSVLDVVVPPDYGFAVIGPQGEVLFHSDENRSLQENFFEEVGEPASVRRHAYSGHAVTWNGDYHGRPHRLHIRQFQDIAGLPWRIVTFRNLAPTLAAVSAHHSGTFRLAALNLSALALCAAGVLVYARIKRRDAGDLLNVAAVVDPRRLAWHLAFVAVGVLGVFISHLPASRQSLSGLYLLFAALPFLAIATSIGARRGDPSSPSPVGDRRVDRMLLRSELALLILLVAALPTAGFARIVDRVQGLDTMVVWLEEMQRRVAGREDVVLARVHGPSYRGLVGARDFLAEDGFAAARNLGRHVYMGFLPSAPRAVEAATRAADRQEAHPQRSPESGQELVRFLLEWNPLPSEDGAGHPPVHAIASRLRLEPLVAGPAALEVDEPTHVLPDALGPLTTYSLPPAKLGMGVVLLVATIAAAYWARHKVMVFPAPVTPTIDSILQSLPGEGSFGVMLIGPPRTQKDRAVSQALRAEAPFRIRLLDVAVESDRVDGYIANLREAAQPSRRLWIHVSNLETHLVDMRRRRLALELLERLLQERPPAQERVVIVTATVDPIAHFEEIFEEERRGIYASPLPEVDLSRFSLLLTLFRRCYVPICPEQSGPDPWWDYDPTQWRAVLAWETRLTPLRYVARELEASWVNRASVPMAELANALSMRAYALYQLLWTSCTRNEKLVLVQLAQEGFVSSHSADVVAALMAKGIIVRRSGPTIFNHSFRTFLRRIERNHVVSEWERGEGQGLWVVAGRLIASSVAAGGLFFLLTQGYSVQGLLPVISGTGVFGVPLVRNVMARLSGGPPQGASSSTA